MSKLRVAIFGCGRMGKLRATAAIKWGAEVSYAFDKDIERATALSALMTSCRPAAGPNPEDWLHVDAVFVCTPPSERTPAREALERGIPTFVEKPLGLSASSAADLAEIAASKGVPAAVGYMNRYRESVRTAQVRLQGQTMLGVSANWVDGIYKVPWWIRPEQSGGPLNEQAAHFVDLVRFLVGEPTDVHAIAAPHPDFPAIIGNATISIRLPNGSFASLFYSCRAEAKAIGFRVFTTREEVCLQGWNLDLIDPLDRRFLCPPVTERYAIFDTETAAFLTGVKTRDTSGILCNLTHAFLTQRVLDAVSQALVEGKSQQLQPENTFAVQ